MEEINKIILEKIQEKIEMKDLLNMFYDIAECILKNNIDLKELELYLKNIYGVSIVFTKRNLKNMVKLYNNYDKNNLKELEQYDWISVIQKLNNKKINNYVNNDILIELNELKNRCNML